MLFDCLGCSPPLLLPHLCSLSFWIYQNYSTTLESNLSTVFLHFLHGVVYCYCCQLLRSYSPHISSKVGERASTALCELTCKWTSWTCFQSEAYCDSLFRAYGDYALQLLDSDTSTTHSSLADWRISKWLRKVARFQRIFRSIVEFRIGSFVECWEFARV